MMNESADVVMSLTLPSNYWIYLKCSLIFNKLQMYI